MTQKAEQNPLRIAYLTGEYPRATDTFIQREVAALRGLGTVVKTFSIRRTGVEHMVGPEQRAEAENTNYVLEMAKQPLTLLKCHAAALKSPSRYFGALKLALQSGGPGLRAKAYQLFYFAEAAVLASALQRNNIDHLHNHIAMASCNVAMLASAISGIPYSFTLHGPDVFFEPERWRLDKKIETASFVACISQYCRKQAMTFSQPKQWPKLHIIHCGVDPSKYDESLIPQQPAYDLIFVGRLAAVKGIPTLIRAVSHLKIMYTDLRVLLIGDGPERRSLEIDAEKAGVAKNITFAGYKSQEEVADMLRQSRVMVLPSSAEGVPVVLMEAMAARLPVVTTKIAGIPELVQDRVSGYLVAPEDIDGLVEKISDLLASDSDCTKFGAAGRSQVQSEFASQDEAARLLVLFRSYIQKAPCREVRPMLVNKGGK